MAGHVVYDGLNSLLAFSAQRCFPFALTTPAFAPYFFYYLSQSKFFQEQLVRPIPKVQLRAGVYMEKWL